MQAHHNNTQRNHFKKFFLKKNITKIKKDAAVQDNLKNF